MTLVNSSKSTVDCLNIAQSVLLKQSCRDPGELLFLETQLDTAPFPLLPPLLFCCATFIRIQIMIKVLSDDLWQCDVNYTVQLQQYVSGISLRCFSWNGCSADPTHKQDKRSESHDSEIEKIHLQLVASVVLPNSRHSRETHKNTQGHIRTNFKHKTRTPNSHCRWLHVHVPRTLCYQSPSVILEKLTEAKMNFKTKQLHQGNYSETQVPQSQIIFLQRQR